MRIVCIYVFVRTLSTDDSDDTVDTIECRSSPVVLMFLRPNRALMVNRWKTQRKITYGCAFGLCVALAACSLFPVPASAVLFESLTSASASDYLVNHDGISWIASNGIATAIPLVFNREVVGGAEGIVPVTGPRELRLATGPPGYQVHHRVQEREAGQVGPAGKHV